MKLHKCLCRFQAYLNSTWLFQRKHILSFVTYLPACVCCVCIDSYINSLSILLDYILSRKQIFFWIWSTVACVFQHSSVTSIILAAKLILCFKWTSICWFGITAKMAGRGRRSRTIAVKIHYHSLAAGSYLLPTLIVYSILRGMELERRRKQTLTSYSITIQTITLPTISLPVLPVSVLFYFLSYLSCFVSLSYLHL